MGEVGSVELGEEWGRGRECGKLGRVEKGGDGERDPSLLVWETSTARAQHD